MSTNSTRTKNGLLLLIGALFLGPLPYLMYIGVILGIIGIILVIISRDSFGRSHSSYVLLSVVVYCVGLIIAFIVGALFTASIISAASTASQVAIQQGLISAFNDLVVGVLLSGAVLGIAYVIFPYALQNRTGRILLYIAFATQLAVSILVVNILIVQVTGAVNQSFSNGTFNPSPLRSLQGQQQFLQLLGLIPSAIYAIAYYNAYSRINKGEVPSSEMLLGSATLGSGNTR
jgi:hypothetical protein